MGGMVVDRAVPVSVRLRQMEVNRGRIGRACGDEEVVARGGRFLEAWAWSFGVGSRWSGVVLVLHRVGLGVRQLQ